MSGTQMVTQPLLSMHARSPLFFRPISSLAGNMNPPAISRLPHATRLSMDEEHNASFVGRPDSTVFRYVFFLAARYNPELNLQAHVGCLGLLSLLVFRSLL